MRKFKITKTLGKTSVVCIVCKYYFADGYTVSSVDSDGVTSLILYYGFCCSELCAEMRILQVMDI